MGRKNSEFFIAGRHFLQPEDISCHIKIIPVTTSSVMWRQITSCNRICLYVTGNFFRLQDISSCSTKFFLLTENFFFPLFLYSTVIFFLFTFTRTQLYFLQQSVVTWVKISWESPTFRGIQDPHGNPTLTQLYMYVV